MQGRSFARNPASALVLIMVILCAAIGCQTAAPLQSFPPSLDGTYELTERVLANGTVLRSPSVEALYTLTNGRLSLNLFVKKSDGTFASESSVGRYTFKDGKYCEWIDYTIRRDLDGPGVTNEVPAVHDHCVTVTSKGGRHSFAPPGEGVVVSFGPDGFTAEIAGEFTDHWKKIG